jgi:hypothetical protein
MALIEQARLHLAQLAKHPDTHAHITPFAAYLMSRGEGKAPRGDPHWDKVAFDLNAALGTCKPICDSDDEEAKAARPRQKAPRSISSSQPFKRMSWRSAAAPIQRAAMHTVAPVQRAAETNQQYLRRLNAVDGCREFVSVFGFRLPLPLGQPSEAFAKTWYPDILEAKVIDKYSGVWNAMKGWALEHHRLAQQCARSGNTAGFNRHVHAWLACKALASKHTTYKSLLADFREKFPVKHLVRGRPWTLGCEGQKVVWD